MFGNIRNAIKSHQKRRQTINELSRMSDRELNDIGISRADIHEVAKRGPASI